MLCVIRFELRIMSSLLHHTHVQLHETMTLYRILVLQLNLLIPHLVHPCSNHDALSKGPGFLVVQCKILSLLLRSACLCQLVCDHDVQASFPSLFDAA